MTEENKNVNEHNDSIKEEKKEVSTVKGGNGHSVIHVYADSPS